MTLKGNIKCVSANGIVTYCKQNKVEDKKYMKAFGLKVEDAGYDAMILKSKGKSDVKVSAEKKK